MQEILTPKDDLIGDNNLTTESIENEYKELFMANNHFEGVSPDTNHYLLRLLWDQGTITAFNVPSTDGVMFGGNAPATFDYMGNKKKLKPILPMLNNTSTLSEINNLVLENHVNCAIGYITSTRVSVKTLIAKYINDVVKTDSAIDFNREQTKVPWFIAYKEKLKNLGQTIRNAVKTGKWLVSLPLTSEQLKDLSPTQLKTDYLIDKHQIQREKYEGKIKTLLGLDNVNFEKKERLVTGEVEANDEEITGYWEAHTKNVQDFCKECNKLLGCNISFNPETETEPLDDKSEDDKEKEGEDNVPKNDDN